MAYGPQKDYGVMLNGVLVGHVDTTGDFEKDKEIVMDLIKQKGLYVQPSEVKTMFRQALSFATTASYLHRKDLCRSPWNVHSVAPFVVNSALGIELYLKALAKANGKTLRGHNLLNLFDTLPSPARKTVETVLPVSLQQWKPKDESDLRACVAGLADAFVEWRYLHEKNRTSTIHIDRIIFVLHVFHEACRATPAIST